MSNIINAPESNFKENQVPTTISTVNNWQYRFFFNSREELRMHVHVSSSDATAKFWLEPIVGLSNSYNFNTKDLKETQKIIEVKQDEFIITWKQHFNQ